MSLWSKIKNIAKEHIEESKKQKQEIIQMSDAELYKRAMREGGRYLNAWLERKRRAKDIRERLKA